MGLFVDIPKPKCWPPPKVGDEQENDRVQELLAYGYKRDPVGDKIHTIFACIFMFCLPLATGPASVSMALLFGYSLLRLPTTWRTLTPLVKSSVYWSILAWVIYSTISISWSSDKTMGWDHASSMWLMAVPIPVLLCPVLRKWKWFIAAGLAGVFLQNIFQLSEIVGSWFLDGNDWISIVKNLFRDEPLPTILLEPIGLGKHHGSGSIFIATAALVFLGTLFGNQKYFKIAVLGLIFAVFGIVVARSRAVWVGFGLSAILLVTIELINSNVSFRKAAIFLPFLVLVVSISATFFGTGYVYEVTDIQKSTMGYFKDGVIKTGNQHRLHWATTLLKNSFGPPAVLHGIVGHGLGSTKTIDFSVIDQQTLKHTSHPHNSFIQNLYEGGLVGLGLFIFMLTTIAKPKNWKSMSPQEIMVLSCVFLWATTSFFDGGQNSGRVLAVLMLLITSSCYAQFFKSETS